MTYKPDLVMYHKHHKGHAAEALAQHYLIDKGLYVYKTVNGGGVDFITFNPETLKLTLLDVKYMSKRTDGSPISRHRPKNKRYGIHILNVNLDTKECFINGGSTTGERVDIETLGTPGVREDTTVTL